MKLDTDKMRWNRDRLGLSLAEVAGKAEVAEGTVLRAEHGEDIRPSSGRRIARALGVELSELIPEKPGRVEELAAAGKREAPREAGPTQTPQKNDVELEKALARVLEPVRKAVLKEQQAANRVAASEGRTQVYIGDLVEAEAGKRFVDEFSPDEIPRAIGEIFLGYARFEREKEVLAEVLEEVRKQARKMLQERDKKIAQLEEENARLRKEAEQESVHR